MALSPTLLFLTLAGVAASAQRPPRPPPATLRIGASSRPWVAIAHPSNSTSFQLGYLPGDDESSVSAALLLAAVRAADDVNGDRRILPRGRVDVDEMAALSPSDGEDDAMTTLRKGK